MAKGYLTIKLTIPRDPLSLMRFLSGSSVKFLKYGVSSGLALEISTHSGSVFSVAPSGDDAIAINPVGRKSAQGNAPSLSQDEEVVCEKRQKGLILRLGKAGS